MDNVAQLALKERSDLFGETAAQMGITPSIAEKDCWVLNKLFTLEPICRNIIFKGGTSLSKVFKVINRFSEDIDLSISRESLGFSKEDFLTEGISGKQRGIKIDALDEKCKEYIQGELLTLLKKSFTSALRDDQPWQLTIDEKEPQLVVFTYPSEESMGEDDDYLKRKVRLELGARSEHFPSSSHEIRSYAAEKFPAYFTKLTCNVKVLAVERTFWEKVTLLHSEHYRPLDKPLPERCSRHYYDVHQMIVKGIDEKAIENITLLDEVRKHKEWFYRSAWAHYEEAKRGTLKLVPAEERLDALKLDYKEMQEMIFPDAPTFEEIIGTLTKFEERVNN